MNYTFNSLHWLIEFIPDINNTMTITIKLFLLLNIAVLNVKCRDAKQTKIWLRLLVNNGRQNVYETRSLIFHWCNSMQLALYYVVVSGARANKLRLNQCTWEKSEVTHRESKPRPSGRREANTFDSPMTIEICEMVETLDLMAVDTTSLGIHISKCYNNWWPRGRPKEVLASPCEWKSKSLYYGLNKLKS